MKSVPATYTLERLKTAALEAVTRNPGLTKLLLAGGAGALGGGLLGGGLAHYFTRRADEDTLKNKLVDAGTLVAQAAVPAAMRYAMRPPEPTLTDQLASIVRAAAGTGSAP